MEDQIYETQMLTYWQMVHFSTWLDKTIGTEVETNEADEGIFYLMIVDLTTDEVDMIRNYENEKGYDHAD